MNDPRDGKYNIQNILVAANGFYGANEGDMAPIVPGGRDTIWIVKNLEDGTTTLTVEELGGEKTWNCVKVGEQDVRVTDEQPATPWIIRGPPGGPYAIEFPARIVPGLYWVADQSEPELPVVLKREEFPPLVWAFHFRAEGAE